MKRLISLALCFIMAFTPCQPVIAAGSTITWTGSASDGSWHTVGNWNPAQVPVDGDYVIIPESSVVEYVYDDTSVSLDCAGDLTVSGGALSLTNGNSSLTGGKLDGAGDITITGGSNLLWSGGSIEGNGTFTVNSGAQLNTDTTSDVGLSRPLVNNGQIMINSGTLCLAGGSGGTGTFTVSDGAYLEFMQGAYSIGGDVVNGGNLSIWDTSSALFNAGYRQENTGNLALKVWGSGSDEYCKLDVSGEAELGGVLEIDFIADYTPQPGDTFEILTCSSRTGEFSSIINNMEGDGITLVPAYTATGLTLKAATVWEVANATELETALNDFQSDDTIKLTADFTYYKGIVIDGKNVTFDTGSFTLNVYNEYSSADPASGVGLEVKNGANVYLIGSGQLYIRQIGGSTAYGVKASNGSTAMVTNVQVTVYEDDAAVGAYADGTGSSIHVMGNVHVMGVGGCGAKTVGRGNITVEGTIMATIYINIGITYKDISSGVDDPEKPGYLKYCTDPVTGIVWVKTAPDTVPTAPQNFTATPGNTQVALSWTAPESDGGSAVTKYQVSKDNGENWTDVGLNTSHTFTGLTNGTEYTFKVRAVNSVGNGAEASAAATPSADPWRGFAPGSGNGTTPETAFLIATPEHLENVRNFLGAEHANKYFKLIADIDLGIAPYNSGDGWEPIGTLASPFTGIFDSDEYTISNLFINRPTTDYVGLFGYTGAEAEILGLGLTGVQVVGFDYVGGMVGKNYGDISESYVTGTVTGKLHVGGLVGYNENGRIDKSYATGTVTGTETGIYYTYVGGLVGSNIGPISDSYARGAVSGQENVGGLVGYNQDSITNSYATGAVTGDSYIGGLVGFNHSDGILLGSYWDTEATGQDDSDGGTGKSTAEMKEQATYEGWDFDDVWGINGSDNDGYPFLRWQGYEHGQTNAPDAPQNFTTAPGSGQVVLSWTAPASDGGSAITKYQVSKDNGANWTDVGLNTSYTFTGLTNGTEYTFKVRAFNSVGSGAEASTTATPTAAPNGPDVAPANLNITTGDTGTFTISLGQSGNEADSATVTSNDTSIATVNPAYVTTSDQAITVTGVSAGNTTVTIGFSGGSYTGGDKTVSVTVTDPVHATHTVDFYSNNSLYASKTVTSGSALGTNWPDNPTRSRYSFGGWFTGQNGAGTQYTSSTIVNADVDLYAKWTYDDGDSDNGGRRTPTTPATPTTPDYKADVKAGSGTETTLPVTVDKDAGTASIDTGSRNLNQGGTVITIPSIPDVDTYSVGIPVPDLSTTDIQGTLTLNTDAGSITVTSNMLTGVAGTKGNKAQLTIGQADKSNLPEDVKYAVGDRPLVQLTLSIDGKQTNWNNPEASVTVSIPYNPTAAELADPEHIVVWYIDGAGNAISVPNGRYDPETGTVIFTTTHFSYYAIAYVHQTFEDLESVDWAKESIEVLASKGILKGITETEYAPQTNIKRADFLYFLIRTLGVDAKFERNFNDINKNAYYYKEIGIAKELGITSGIGNNRFSPDESITRQDMMVLTERALRMLKKLEVQGTASDLEKFSDQSLIGYYAIDSVASLIKEGLIVGNSDNVNPLGNTTRAEAAVFFYRVYIKY